MVQQKVSGIAACTIVAKNMISLARVLAASFRRHHPDVPFVVLLADDVDGRFDPAGEPFELIPFGALAVPDGARFRFRYTQQALSYAATPFLIAHLLDRGFGRVVFFKQESLVLGSHYEIFEWLRQDALVMTPHLLSPLAGPDRVARELNILLSGVFNVGLLGVADVPEGRRFLSWWQDRVLTHCHHDVLHGMHYEQRWLDLVPSYFTGVRIVRDPAWNVAHWNLPERRVSVSASGVIVDGMPCRLFRFSGFDPEHPLVPTRYSNRLTWENIGEAREVFVQYARALDEAGYQESKHWPFAYGCFDNGVAVPDFARRLYLELGAAADQFGDPRCTSHAGSFYEWLNGAVHHTTDGEPYVSRLWHSVYLAREDVQRAYPDALGADRPGFLAWTHSSGAREHGIPNPFLPRPFPLS